jgi:hypothetical protein
MKSKTFGIAVITAVSMLAVACGGDPTGADGSCFAVVSINGAFFTPTQPAPAQERVSTNVFLTVTRNTGCLDQGEPADPLAHGESNFLEAGTTLHTIEGFDSSERLAHYSEEIQEWLALETLESLNSSSRGQGQQ